MVRTAGRRPFFTINNMGIGSLDGVIRGPHEEPALQNGRRRACGKAGKGTVPKGKMVHLGHGTNQIKS